MTDLAVAFGLAAVAELGDKSQLLALTLATRNPALPVLTGIATAEAVMLAAATALGAVVGAALPTRWVELVGGVTFLAFGVWALAERDHHDDRAAIRGRSAWLTAFVAFVVAEFGDKTMLVTATLATTRSPLATWVGATLGVTAVSAVSVAVGRQAGTRLPRRAVRFAAAAAFVLLGVLLLASAAGIPA